MEDLKNEQNIGIVKISDEVVSVIAGIAAEEITGVKVFHHGVTSSLPQLLKGKKNSAKSIKVTLEEDKATIEIAISVQYGVKIIDVVTSVQENVKKTVEAMTGLVVSGVDVFVQNIYIAKENEEENA